MAIDRRVQRTRSALLDALMSLMATHGYRGVSVDALLDRAHVARSTFYAHFRGKDDLLRENVRRIRALAVRPGNASGMHGLLRFNHAFFAHALENRALYVALLRDADRGTAVFKKMQGVLTEVAAEELQRAGCAAGLIEPAAHLFVGAQWGILTWWLERRPTWPADAAHKRFERLIAPVLATLRS